MSTLGGKEKKKERVPGGVAEKRKGCDRINFWAGLAWGWTGTFFTVAQMDKHTALCNTVPCCST